LILERRQLGRRARRRIAQGEVVVHAKECLGGFGAIAGRKGRAAERDRRSSVIAAF
jgi:hypothetical protein